MRAATNHVPERTSLEIEPAAAAGRRQDLRRDEQAADERGPEHEVREDHLDGHAAVIGRPALVD
jgi:hypothetical protein